MGWMNREYHRLDDGLIDIYHGRLDTGILDAHWSCPVASLLRAIRPEPGTWSAGSDGYPCGLWIWKCVDKVRQHERVSGYWLEADVDRT